MKLLLITLLIFSSLHAMQEDQEGPLTLEQRFKKAALENDLSTVQACVANGVNINAGSYPWSTALSISCCNQCYPVAHFLLLQKNIEVNPHSEYPYGSNLHSIFFNYQNRTRSAFTEEQKLSLTRLFLAREANLDIKDMDEDTPLQVALKVVRKRDACLERIKLLVSAGSKMELNKCDKTPLTIALDRELPPEYVHILLQSPHVDLQDVKSLLSKSLTNFHDQLKQTLSIDEPFVRTTFESLRARLKDNASAKALLQCESQMNNYIGEEIQALNIHICSMVNFRSSLSAQFVESCKKIKERRDIHLMLARYYKTRIWLERARRLRKISLPLDVIKVIASASVQ